MKKKILSAIVILLVILIGSLNRIVQLKYHLNLIEYHALSQELTEYERSILRENSPLIYGGNINEPPLGIYNEQNGQYIGLVVDYISAISIELGTTIESRPMIWREALEALMAGETDLCDMIPSEERGKDFYFTDPLYHLRGMVVTRSENTSIHKIQDLQGKTVGVQKGDYAIERIKERAIEVSFVYTDNLDIAMDLLNDGVVEAVLGDEPVILYYMSELSNRDHYQLLEESLYDEVSVIAVPKSKPELIRILNKAIFSLEKKGLLNKIHHKWSGLSSSFYQDNRTEFMQLYLILVLLGIVLSSYVVYLWNNSLKRLVTERTIALETIKNELQITFDGMKTFLVVIDNHGKIKNINAAFLQYLDKNFDGLINKQSKEVSILTDLNIDLQDFSQTYTSHQKEFMWHDGNIYEIDIYPLKPEAETTQILIVLEDRTNERLQEQKMTHANKMAAIGQLASGIAHELRNPLGVIRNSSFILNDIDDVEEEERQTALMAIDNSVSRASKIIDNLLKFSRLSHDKEDLVYLKAFLEDIGHFFVKKFNEQKINFKINCTEECIVYLNSEALRHIVINLISNAVDAMPGGGMLEITCRKTSDRFLIEIRDSGTGIPQEVQEKIFDPFFTTKEIGKGTGLGLYIVYSEAQKMNAEISLDSIEGKGTTFTFSILQRSKIDE